MAIHNHPIFHAILQFFQENGLQCQPDIADCSVLLICEPR